jgi:ABC-type Mn2+/Zn2+ transport system permease subunit
MGDQPPGAPRPPRPPQLGDLFWIGTACAISVIGGLGLGYLVDAKAGTSPWVTLGGLAFGVIMAVVIAVHELRRYF